MRLAAIPCLGGSFLPVYGTPSRILSRRSRSRPAAAKRAANGGGLEGDRRLRNNAVAIRRPIQHRTASVTSSSDVYTSNHLGSPIEWFLLSLIITSSACSC